MSDDETPLLGRILAEVQELRREVRGHGGQQRALLTKTRVCKILGIDKKTLQCFLESGAIRGVTIGKREKISSEELDRVFLEGLPSLGAKKRERPPLRRAPRRVPAPGQLAKEIMSTPLPTRASGSSRLPHE